MTGSGGDGAMTRGLRLLAALPVLAGLVVTLHAARIGPSLAGCAQAAGTHHAALIVQHADGEPLDALCVSFSQDSITGEDLLNLSHVHYATADYGSYGKAVCQIDSEPQQYPPGCWTASSPYWAMFVSRGGSGWQTSSLGISSQTFGDGDAEGFRYEGQSDGSSPPSPAGVCPPPATATPTPAPTARQSQTPVTGVPRPATSAPQEGSSAPSTSQTPAGTAAVSTAAAPSQATSPGIPGSSGASLSASAGPAATSFSTPPPSPPSSPGAGTWIALGLGAALGITLLARLAAARRRAGSPAGPP